MFRCPKISGNKVALQSVFSKSMDETHTSAISLQIDSLHALSNKYCICGQIEHNNIILFLTIYNAYCGSVRKDM